MANTVDTVEEAETRAYHELTDSDKLRYLQSYMKRFQGTIHPIITEALVYMQSTLLEGLWIKLHEDDSERVFTNTHHGSDTCVFTEAGVKCTKPFTRITGNRKYCEAHITGRVGVPVLSYTG